jgi:acylpyruvate hydrolase
VRLVVYGPERRVGVLSGERVIDACSTYAALLAARGAEPSPPQRAAETVPAELGAFIAAGERALAGARDAVDYLAAGAADDQLSWPLEDLVLHAPIAARARLFMAGNNYPAHAAGAEGDTDPDPLTVERTRAEVREVGLRGFISFAENAVGPGADIVHPARTDMLDYEGEIAAVIGRPCKDVRAAEAGELLWGFFLLNDLSARRAIPTADNPTSRFARDKNFDTSKSAGPFLVVGEIDDPQDIGWETRVNGELRQRGNTREMIFTFAEMLEYISEDLTLLPGDVLGAGTSSGTVMDSTPIGADGTRDAAAFLSPGDVVELSNPTLGTLRNAVVAKGG